MVSGSLNIIYFNSPAEFRIWLEQNHTFGKELWVGYHKKASGVASMTWPESVDEALCFGWIDGIRKSVDELRYTIRFTARRVSSVWSNVNIQRVQQLTTEGRMQPAGLRAFEARKENKSGIYSYENRRAEMDEPYTSKFKRNKKAWKFFESQPASYRRAAIWWVVSAKKEETRVKRLAQLIVDSAAGKRISQFVGTKKSE